MLLVGFALNVMLGWWWSRTRWAHGPQRHSAGRKLLQLRWMAGDGLRPMRVAALVKAAGGLGVSGRRVGDRVAGAEGGVVVGGQGAGQEHELCDAGVGNLVVGVAAVAADLDVAAVG